MPPMKLTNCVQIAKPRPVPPYLRVVELSPCSKGLKMAACLDSGTPMPVSRTEKRTVDEDSPMDSRLTVTVTSPRSVNLTALPTRLSRIWRKRLASPNSSAGTCGATS